MKDMEMYEVVVRDDNLLEFRHKGGAVLLTTERVSLDTLFRLYLEDEVVI